MWRIELAQDPGGGCTGLGEGTYYDVPNEAILGELCSPNSHKTRYMVFLLSPLGSPNYSSLPIPSDFAVVTMENVEVLPIKDPECNATFRDSIAKAYAVLHPSTQKLAAPGTINCWWHLAFPPGVQSWASQYHRNSLHVIWN